MGEGDLSLVSIVAGCDVEAPGLGEANGNGTKEATADAEDRVRRALRAGRRPTHTIEGACGGSGDRDGGKERGCALKGDVRCWHPHAVHTG